jgi:predicted PurR-regulated permease PerM
MASHPASDLTRTTLAVLFIGILIAACFWVLRPFITSLLWAAMMVIATWPFFIQLQSRLWGRRWLAVLAMVVLLLMVLIVPVCFAVLTILDHTEEIIGWFKSLSAIKVPPPPAWVVNLPVIGSTANQKWQQLAVTSPEELSRLLSPYASHLVTWFVAQAGNFGLLLLNFLLSIAIAAVLYAKGEVTATGIRMFAHRLAGQNGDEAAVLSAKAIRGVALGIVVTALAQSALGGIGLYFAGVPAAALLTAVMLMLCIAQLGPSLVLIPAAIWLFYSGFYFTGTLFAVWAVFVSTVDNVLRPVLIRKGVDLPLLLIITGVIGGLIGFGFVGLFIGPVILAVTFTLIRAWVITPVTPADSATLQTAAPASVQASNT